MSQVQQTAYTYLKTALGLVGESSLPQLEMDFLASEGYGLGSLDERWSAYLAVETPPTELSVYLLGRQL